MLSVKEAAQIGINGCIDKIGRAFVILNRNNSTSAYGECENNQVYCYVGVDDAPYLAKSITDLILDNVSHFPYYASCKVSRVDGTISFLDFVSAP